MQPLTSPKVLKEILERHGFRFTKSLGQNFLVDENIVNKIVQGAGLTEEDFVLEIGPGAGTLTRAAAHRAAKVVAVEIDKALIPVLEETLDGCSNVVVINEDILELDIRKLTDDIFGGRPFKVIANLPYYITTPIILRFFEEDIPFSSMTLMMQSEVVDRLTAKPGTKEYGMLSIAASLFTSCRVVARVPASVFMPPPKVGSIVVALDRLNEPAAAVNSRTGLFSIIRAVLGQRRKTLLNALSSAGLTDAGKADLSEMLISIGIDPLRRGESLTVEEFARISNRMFP